MSAIPRLKQDVEPVACGVCRRRAYGFGQAPRQGQPILWICDSLDCIRVSRTVYDMPEQRLDAYEEKARREAGQEAGAYLDSLGVTDLEKLAPEEWSTFLDKVILGYEQSLRRQFTTNAAPF